jgi:hypothetical protein
MTPNLRTIVITQFIDNVVIHTHHRGSSTGLFIPRHRTEFFKKSFSYSGAKLWNRIPENNSPRPRPPNY